MKEEQFIDDKTLRDSVVDHYEVLEKVKELLLLPEVELATAKQVAEFYEVNENVISTIYNRHTEELVSDGIKTVSYKDFLNIQYVHLEKTKGKTTFFFDDGTSLSIPNRGLRVFPKRAILRIGMLLRDSEVAREVRTQLLNIEEKTSTEIKLQDINEEQKLMLNVGMAFASGNIEELMKATTEYNAFQNRYIEQLKNDNKALVESILTWDDRHKLNAGVRKLAGTTGISVQRVWSELYKNLQYKYSISLKQRGNKPYIQWIREEEWNEVMKTFCALCETHGQSPSEMFQQLISSGENKEINKDVNGQ